MSYVLDALRKSELERRLAAGKGDGLLNPIMVERRQTRRIPIVLAGAGSAAAAAVLASWLWLRPAAPDISMAVEKSASAQHAIPAVPPAASAPNKDAAEPATRAMTTANPAGPKPVAKKSIILPNPRAGLPSPAPGAPGLPQKDIPEVTIAGYIRDEHGGTLAMVNDKLVREGDEIEPGLRLEKILGEGSVFSYKGHRFRR